MSGYLEVKYPFRSNLGLNPFKSWKRQWCILRPSPTCAGGGSLAVYCSEAGAAAGTVELPSGCIVKRAKSRTRPHAFAVFSIDEPCKPRVLLAAQTLHDTQLWMDKIRELLNGDKLLGTEKLLKDSYSVTVVPTDLARRCDLPPECVITLSSTGLLLSRAHSLGTFLDWKHVTEVLLSRENGDRHRTCTLTVDSGFSEGHGEMKFTCALAGELVAAVKQSLRVGATAGRKLSRSEGDLRSTKCEDSGEVRRSSWYSGPSEISLDDTDLIMSKEAKRIPSGQLSRCSGAGDLALRARALLHLTSLTSLTSFDDSASERVSIVSVSSIASASSGVYEEIPEPPHHERDTRRDMRDMRDTRHDMRELRRDMCDLRDDMCDLRDLRDEPTYESVAECIYATMRRSARRMAPPLPPRHPFGTMKLGESWSARGAGGCGGAGGGAGVGAGGGGGAGAADGVTRHSSLGSLPRHCARTSKRQPFSVFRKRLKSDSRIATSPKSETAKENKDVETKKKKFDFTPTRDIFKSFKVSRKMKNLKITSGNLGKGETKSCEFLDETQHITTNRCSKSVECLEGTDQFVDEADLSLEMSDEAGVAALALPQEIVQLIIRGRDTLNKIRLKETQIESDYVPMSPIVPPTPIEHHYIVMSPRTHLA